MKHTPYFLLLFFILVSSNIFSQNYHERDKEGLREILRKEEIGYQEVNQTNLQLFGLEVSDTLNWKTSENWVAKVQGMTWNDDVPKRLIKFSNGFYLPSDATSIDFSCFAELIELNTNRRSYGYFLKPPVLKISSLVKLKYLSFSQFVLESNDFGCFPQLEYLRFGATHMGNISVAKNLKLKHLDCFYENRITELDVSNNVDLEYLKSGFEPSFNKINVRGLKKLKHLDLALYFGGEVESLDVSDNIALEYLNCHGFRLTSLDVSNNTNLDTLICSSNRLKELDLKKLNNLVYLDCMLGTLEKLDVTNNVKLKYFSCPANNLKELDLSNNPDIEVLYIEENALETLILPSVDKKDRVNVSNNRLRMSMLPIPKYRQYLYNDQGVIEGGIVDIGEIVDLSSEYKIAGVVSAYNWSVNETAAEVTSVGQGTFVLPKGYSGSDFYCKITNSTFPTLTMTYHVKAGNDQQLPTGIDNEQEVQTLFLNSHTIKNGEKIQLINSSNYLGVAELYTINGEFVSKQSVGQHTFITVPKAGIYLLHAVMNNGAKKVFKVVVR